MERSNTPIISVLVPAYNVEKHIARCLSSIVEQTFTSYEVIVINDGSIDHTKEIVQHFVETYPQIQLYNQENKGIGAVRNKAISLAKGEFIAFVDGDDYIYPTFLETLYNSAIKHNADISCCNFALCNNNYKVFHKTVLRKRKGVYTGTAFAKSAILDVTVRSYLWNKLWRRSLFVDYNIVFPEHLFEDFSVVSILCSKARRVVVTNQPLYLYTKHRGGISSITNNNCIPDYLAAFQLLKSHFRNEGTYKTYRNRFFWGNLKVRITVFSWMVMLAFHHKTLKNIKTQIRYTFCSDETLQKLVEANAVSNS